MAEPTRVKGMNASTTKANFHPEMKARVKHPIKVTKEEAMVPKRAPVALEMKR